MISKPAYELTEMIYPGVYYMLWLADGTTPYLVLSST